MKILIIGGGPAGLLFSYLMKRRDARHEILVREQSAQNATYGFGIGLADGAMQQLLAADAHVHDRLSAQLHMMTRQEFRHDDDSVWFDRKKPAGSLSRKGLLATLATLCAEVGVAITYETRVDYVPEMGAEFDLVVGADGANSTVRTAFASELGTSVSYLTNRFAWYGTKKFHGHSLLSFKRHAGGYFVGHVYPYTPDMSTFVVECDARTWDDLHLETMTADERRQFAEGVFAKELDGHDLLENKSTWRQFPVVSSERWHVGHHVLLGDALRTVHPSIGSGTRLAFEDAMALSAAFDRHGNDVDAALVDFTKTREPAMEKLTSAARRSYTWYEGFRDKMEVMDVVELGYDFLMRTGRISQERLRADFPQFVERWDMHRSHA